LEPLLPETKCIATKAFLNTFPSDTTTTAQMASFRLQCARLMTLNPLAQVDFIKCFDQWNREKLTLNLLVKPSSSWPPRDDCAQRVATAQRACHDRSVIFEPK